MEHPHPHPFAYTSGWRYDSGVVRDIINEKAFSPGALDFEMEKNSRKLIFSGKLLEGA